MHTSLSLFSFIQYYKDGILQFKTLHKNGFKSDPGGEKLMSLKDATDSLAPLATALISVVLVVGIGAVTLAEFSETSFEDVQVTAEQDQPSAPLPSNFTLDESTGSDFVTVSEDTVDVVLEDASAGTNTTLTQGTDFVVFNDAGVVELQNTSATTDFDDTADTVFTDYEFQREGTATQVVSDGENALGTFSDFFQVVVVVGIASVIFLLLGGLRRAGGRSMA